MNHCLSGQDAPMFTMLLPLVLAQSTPAQTAANGLVFLLQAPGNCFEVHADMPPNAPSKNMAALWIRSVFHDAGTFDPTGNPQGGLDGSSVQFLNTTENAGLAEAMVTRFSPNLKVNMSVADLIAIGGLVSVTHCGGPTIPFQPGWMI